MSKAESKREMPPEEVRAFLDGLRRIVQKKAKNAQEEALGIVLYSIDYARQFSAAKTMLDETAIDKHGVDRETRMRAVETRASKMTHGSPPLKSAFSR